MVEHVYCEGLFVPDIIRSNGNAIVYSRDEPIDLLEAGTAVGYYDFQDAARTVEMSKRIANTAFKQTISLLGEGEEPFSFVDQHDLKLTGSGVCTSYGFSGILLDQFYIRTQNLYSHIDDIGRMPAHERPHSAKSLAVLRAVLYDGANA